MPRNVLREMLIVALIALIAAFAQTMLLFPHSVSLDSFYHYNAAVSLASGEGLTDHVIWSYVGQPEPETLPVITTPSHVYWMPLTSIISGVSMAIFGISYRAAQLPHALMLVGIFLMTYWLGWKIGGSRRHAILSLVLVIAGTRYIGGWGEIDTFAPYGFVGTLGLIALGYGATRSQGRWYALAGVMAGLAHLTRSDGLLFVIVGWLTLLYAWIFGFSGRKIAFGVMLRWFVIFTLAYFIVMLPWFLRMMDVVGSPLPVGGLGTAWLRDYADIFRYPPDFSPSELFSDGLTTFFETRWTGLSRAIEIFVGIEGYILLTPLMLIALWRRTVRGTAEQSAFAFPMVLFALGIHALMTIVFPMPGYRGGLLHGAVALLPFWTAYGVAGIDDVIGWVARRLPHWNAPVAKRNFSILFTIILVIIGLITLITAERDEVPPVYAELDTILPEDARVMSVNPPELYYHTGRGGAVLPNGSPDVILQVAERYDVDYLLVEEIELNEEGLVETAVVFDVLLPYLNDMPEFLAPVDLETSGARLYVINR